MQQCTFYIVFYCRVCRCLANVLAVPSQVQLVVVLHCSRGFSSCCAGFSTSALWALSCTALPGSILHAIVLIPNLFFSQLKLWYDKVGHQLIVTVLGAKELPVRDDGRPRNPYVKIYFLPDRRWERATENLRDKVSFPHSDESLLSSQW